MGRPGQGGPAARQGGSQVAFLMLMLVLHPREGYLKLAQVGRVFPLQHRAWWGAWALGSTVGLARIFPQACAVCVFG